MNIVRSAQAGSFESSDIMVLVEPLTEKTGRKIEINSTVMLQYGNEIKQIINDYLDKENISDIHIIVNDKGALNTTIEARIETAVKRACNSQKGTIS